MSQARLSWLLARTMVLGALAWFANRNISPAVEAICATGCIEKFDVHGVCYSVACDVARPGSECAVAGPCACAFTSHCS